jgi:hypothetical protein
MLALLVCVALASTVIKLYFALTTFGSGEVACWSSFLDYMVENGTVSIYASSPFYSHPPAMSGLLLWLAPLAPYAPNGFPFLIRLPAILSDVASGFLLYSIVAQVGGPRRGLWAALLFWASPVAVMVSGYHGNIDPIFMMLILLVAHQAMRGKPAWQIGALLGLACNVDLVPLVTVPLFFFWLPTRREKTWFAAGLLALLVLGYGYHTTQCFSAMMKNFFDDSAEMHFWGLPGLRSSLGLENGGLAAFAAKGLAVFFVVLGWGFGRHANRVAGKERASVLLVGLAWTFLTLLILSPRFGVQDLSCLNVVLPLQSLVGMLGYNILAGTALYRIYDFWHRGGPWKLADLDKATYPGGYDFLWAHLVWIFLVLWAIWNLGRWWGSRTGGVQPPAQGRPIARLGGHAI